MLGQIEPAVVFKNINDVPLEYPTGKIYGVSNLDKVSSLQIGTGGRVFRGDWSGIWLGAERWADAPFRVSMDGNVELAATSDITVGGDSINTNAEIFSHLSAGDQVLTGNGGVGSWIDWDGASFSLDGSKFTNQSVYFEGAGTREGITNATLYFRIYNVTDSKVLAGSTISFTLIDPVDRDRVRSAALTLIGAETEYKLQIRVDSGVGVLCHFLIGRLVVVQS